MNSAAGQTIAGHCIPVADADSVARNGGMDPQKHGCFSPTNREVILMLTTSFCIISFLGSKESFFSSSFFFLKNYKTAFVHLPYSQVWSGPTLTTMPVQPAELAIEPRNSRSDSDGDREVQHL